MQQVYILSAVRTPIGDFMGSLSSLSNVQLGIVVAKELIKRARVSANIVEELTCGLCFKGGSKGNPARQIQINADIPASGYASTIDQQCGSGMKAVKALSQQIILEKTNVGIALGVESMSNAPYVLNRARNTKMGDMELLDSLTYDGLVCALCDYHMGITAENIAEEYGITRQEQDNLSVMSHQRALEAQKNGNFDNEIVPITLQTRKGETVVDMDEHPRKTDYEILAKMRPAFKKEGTVTAGNSSGINDGAAGLLLANEKTVIKLGLNPIGRIVSTASIGVEPSKMGIGPVFAIPKSLEYARLTADQIDYYEINEAFAAQFLACNRALKIDPNMVNCNGSGISLGHPVGATGARLIVSLLYELKRRKGRYGVASLCVGGGPAMSVVIENID